MQDNIIKKDINYFLNLYNESENKGKQFFYPNEREEYLKQLEVYDNLYEGNHLKVYGDKIAYDTKNLYQIDNIFEDVINTKKSIMERCSFNLYSINYKSEYEKYLSEVKFKTLFADSILFTIKYGNAFWYYKYEYNFKKKKFIQIPKLASPKAIWYVSESEDDEDIDFIYFSKYYRNLNKLRVILHSRFDITEIEINTENNGINIINSITHNFGDFCVINIKNFQTNKFISKSDITNTALDKQIQANNFLTIEKYIINQYSKNRYITDNMTLNNLANAVNKNKENKQSTGHPFLPNAQFSLFDGLNDFTAGSNKENYYMEKLEPNAYIEKLAERRKEIVGEAFSSMGLDSAILDNTVNSNKLGVASGYALEYASYKTLSNIDSKLKIYAECIKNLLEIYSYLEDVINNSSKFNLEEIIEVEFEVSLYQTEMDKLEKESKKLDNEIKKMELGIVKSKKQLSIEIENYTEPEYEKQKLISEKEELESLDIRKGDY